ncbi:MAG: diadenylate cyclase [Chlamydiota bacterium]|nr:diadenylate cyclase [Chlamydiota bacterium]
MKKKKKISIDLIHTAFQFIEEQNFEYLLVSAKLKGDIECINNLRSTQKILWITPENFSLGNEEDFVAPPLGQKMDLSSRVSFSLFLAYIKNFIGYEDLIACLTTQCKVGAIDTLMVSSPRKLFPWLAGKERVFKNLLQKISPVTFVSLLEVALRLVKEGREGKPIGTMFVLAHPQDLEKYTEQLILNPLKGHPKKTCNIHNPVFFETIRELSAIDGGFVVSPKGTVISSGTYFHSTAHHKSKLKKGFGTRHAAAMSLTKQTESIAIVLSESSSDIRIFYAGKMIFEGGVHS